MNWKALIVYKAPDLAAGAVAALVFVLAVNLVSIWFPHVDKFGFIIGLSLGIFFLGNAHKLRGAGFSNLAALTFCSGFAMALFGIVLTDVATLAASALDDFAAPLVAAIGSYFSKVESNDV